jgi:hypothetical protein
MQNYIEFASLFLEWEKLQLEYPDLKKFVHFILEVTSSIWLLDMIKKHLGNKIEENY